MVSRFISEYFHLNTASSYEIFHTEKKEYGTVHYAVEKTRTCSWVEAALKVATYFTLFIPVIIWIVQKLVQPKGSIEVWSADNHFQIDDIRRLAHQAIGLRHISTRERASKELGEGFSLGCSFNLTFLELKNFDNITPKQQLKKVYDYEQAVNSHFTNAFLLDGGPIDPQNTKCSDVFERLKKCCFLLVDYSGDNSRPVDMVAWGGLGRYPKWSVRASQVRKLLPFFDGFTVPFTTIASKAEGEKFFDTLFDRWRRDLLVALRTTEIEVQHLELAN